MSHAVTRKPARPRSTSDKTSGPPFLRNRKVIATSVGALLFLFLLIWAIGHLRADRDLAKVRQMREGLFSEEGKNLSREERGERFKAMREAVEKLPAGQRDELMKEGMQQRGEREKEKYAKFFAANRKEQIALLDADIKRQEERRKQFEAFQQANAQAANAGGMSSASSNRPASTPEQRENFRKKALDFGTPEQRAQATEYRRQMNDRRQQLGLPPLTGRGGFGGPGPGAGARPATR